MENGVERSITVSKEKEQEFLKQYKGKIKNSVLASDVDDANTKLENQQALQGDVTIEQPPTTSIQEPQPSKPIIKDDISDDYDIDNPEFINSIPNEILTYQNAPQWFDNRARFPDPKSILGEGETISGRDFSGKALDDLSMEYTDLVKKKIYAGTHGYNPATGALFKLENNVDVPFNTQVKFNRDYRNKFSWGGLDDPNSVTTAYNIENELNPGPPIINDLFMIKNENEALEDLNEWYAGWGVKFEAMGASEDLGANNIKATAYNEDGTIKAEKIFPFNHFVKRSHKNIYNIDGSDQGAKNAAEEFNMWIDTYKDPDGGKDKSADWMLKFIDVSHEQNTEVNKKLNVVPKGLDSIASKLGLENKTSGELAHIISSIFTAEEFSGSSHVDLLSYRNKLHFKNNKKYGEISEDEILKYKELLGADYDKIDKEYGGIIIGKNLGRDDLDVKYDLQKIIAIEQEELKKLGIQEIINTKYNENEDEFWKVYYNPVQKKEDPNTSDYMHRLRPNHWKWDENKKLYTRPGGDYYYVESGEPVDEDLLESWKVDGQIIFPVNVNTLSISNLETRKSLNSLYNSKEFQDVVNNMDLTPEDIVGVKSAAINSFRREEYEKIVDKNIRNYVKNLSPNLWSDEEIREKMGAEITEKLKKEQNLNPLLHAKVKHQKNQVEQSLIEYENLTDYIANQSTNLEKTIQKIAKEENITNIDDFFENENAVNKLAKEDKVYNQKIKDLNVLVNEVLPIQQKKLAEYINELNEGYSDENKLLLLKDALQRDHSPLRVLATEAGAGGLDLLKTLTFDGLDA